MPGIIISDFGSLPFLENQGCTTLRPQITLSTKILGGSAMIFSGGLPFRSI